MTKPDFFEDLTSTIQISHYPETNGCHGYWLHDETQGMNLSMRAETKEAALLEALVYYQKALAEIKEKYEDLNGKVRSFLDQFRDDDEYSNEDYD